MPDELAIQAAIDDFEAQEVKNFSETAKKFGVNRITLTRRFKNETVSVQQFHQEAQQLLSAAQEEVLLEHIESLTRRSLAFTPQILANLVYEIVRKPLGHNWVHRFCKRHENRISSVYLKGIDKARLTSESSKIFEHFFTGVYSLYILSTKKITKFV